MRVIVTGATGYVGRHVCKHALAQGMSVIGTFHSSKPDGDGVEWAHLDVTGADAVERLIANSGAEAIVHTAAGLSGSLAPLESRVNWAVNAQGAANVARCAARHGVQLVHISSDAVYSGRLQPYTEEDRPDPIYPYGAAKAAAELAVGALCPTAVTARPSLITSDGDQLSRREAHFLDAVAGRRDGVFFSDEVRCPVGVNDFALACLELARRGDAGVFNVTGPEEINMYKFAQLIAKRHGFDSAAVQPSTHEEASVSRPGRIVLDTSKARALLVTRLRGIREIAHRPS